MMNKNDPAEGIITVTDGTLTLSDTVNLKRAVRSIRATGAGNIKITGLDGVNATLAFAAGETRHVQAVRIWSTGTTATGIEAGI